jgi:hypothetical protein
VKKSDCIPKSTYRRHVLRARNTSNTLTYCRDYELIMSKLTALFTQDVINLASLNRVKRTTVDDKEFFMCTAEFLCPRWTVAEQKYHLAQLQESKFITLARMGMPSVRWIHFDIESIENAVDEALEKQTEISQSVEKQTNCQSVEKQTNKLVEKSTLKNKSTSYSFTKKKDSHCCSQARNGDIEGFFSSDNIKDSPAKQLAILLAEVSIKLRKTIRQANMKSWARYFKLLLKLHDIEYIKKVIHLHHLNYHSQYWPKILCAKRFCEEFHKIEDAIAREQKNSKGSTGFKTTYEGKVKVSTIEV